MNILAIDTSNQVLGVAISKDGSIQAEFTVNRKRNHSVTLMPAIDHVMRETEMTPDQLDRIVVAKGPGSYTGVRIGLSTAKTLAWTLNIPIVAISSLELLAHNILPANGLVCPFFDARRGLIYTGLYEAKNGEVSQKVSDLNINTDQWLEELKTFQQPIFFLSQDLSIHQSAIEAYLGDVAVFPSKEQHLPRAGTLALLGGERKPSSVHELTPNYIRLVEAEVNWLKEQEQKKHE